MKSSRILLPMAVLVAAALGGIVYSKVRTPANLNAKNPAEPGPRTHLADSDADGIPDFLLLDGVDADAFRAWFTFLAEGTYYQAPGQIPVEVDDCAALLRYAYREALKKHDGAWANSLKLPLPPALPPIHKYHYPLTPLGANLFRIREGVFSPGDMTDGTWAQFADAETLRQHNTRFISKDIRAARSGDLLFFRQTDQQMPDHAMIYVGQSRYEPDSNHWIVYHTGPTGNEKGEIRRPTVESLMNHREPRWHPVAANANFLGVYRWSILQ